VKVMLIGRLDREDGGYMCPMGVVIPCGTKTYQEAIAWLKDVPELVSKIIEEQCDGEYNDELEESIELTIDDLTEFHYEYGQLHIDFEKDHYIYDIQLSIDIVEVYEQTISESNQ